MHSQGICNPGEVWRKWGVLLGVGLFQQSAPELGFVGRVDKHQAVPHRGETVVHHHVQPLVVFPELRDRERERERERERREREKG